MRRSASFRLACTTILCGLAIGCGATDAPIRDVAGNVSIDGKPLNQGVVILTDEKGEHVYADIDSDGGFIVPQVAPGLFRAAISVPKIVARTAGRDVDPARGARPLPVPIPNRYADDSTSGLQFTIDRQTEKLTIELKK